MGSKNEFRNKPYCKGCEDRIQIGKAYEKKDILSAWYVVIKMLDGNAYYRKMDFQSIPYEKDIDPNIMFTMKLDEFKKEFEFVATIFCPYEMNPRLWDSQHKGENKDAEVYH